MFENEFHQLHALLKNTEKIGPEEEIFINHLYDMIKINFNPDDSIYSIRAYIKDYEKKQHHI
jgi:hypothetical protein